MGAKMVVAFANIFLARIENLSSHRYLPSPYFNKALDLIDRRILVSKPSTYDIPDPVISWITILLTTRKQRVIIKLGHECLTEWGVAPAEVPQGPKSGAMAAYHHNQRTRCSCRRSLEIP